MATQPTTTGRHGARPDGKAIVLGTLMVILGVLCMVVPKAAGRAAVLYLGLLLALSGVVELISGMSSRGEQHRGLMLGGGILWLVIGLLMLGRPAAGLGAITLLLAVFVLAAGVSALLVSLLDRYPGWSWDLIFGAAAVVLGLATVSTWSSVALWLPGSLVGIAIVVRGATMVAGAFEPEMRPGAARTV